jgi:hypothetical protein
VVSNFEQLFVECDKKGLGIEVARRPSEKPHPGYMKGRTNFEGWWVRVTKGKKRICRAKMGRDDSFDDVAADLLAFLHKENHL